MSNYSRVLITGASGFLGVNIINARAFFLPSFNLNVIIGKDHFSKIFSNTGSYGIK